MRVAHLTTVHHSADPRIFERQCVTISDHGYDVTLLAQHPCDEVREGVTIKALSEVSGRYRRLPLLFEAFRRACSVDAALYHFHDPELIPVAWMLKQFTEARIVYDMHEDYHSKGGVESRVLRALERWCFSWVDHVVVANENELFIPEASGVDHTFIANYPRSLHEAPNTTSPEGNLRLIYTGVIAESRGLSFLMDIATRAAKEKLPFEIQISGICNFPEQRQMARDRYRTERLESVMSEPTWDRYTSPAKLEQERNLAHVGLMLLAPLKRHNKVYPTKLFEYLHAGLPILATDQPVWREFIETHNCGEVIPYEDVDAACRVLECWHREPETYRRLSENALKAAQKYRWESMGERLLDLYERLIGPPTG